MTRTLTLPLRVVSEANAHTHWRVRQKRAKRQRAGVLVYWRIAEMPEGQKPTGVRLTRLAPRCLDSDNLAGAFKHVRDEVAALCGFDDRAPDVAWDYAQERGDRGAYGIRIEVTW